MLDRFKVPDEIAVRVAPATMKLAVERIFEALGTPPADAERCAETLLYADRRGIDSHGVSNMMRAYVAGIRGGTINPKPNWRILREADATATIDSDEGLGLTVGPQAMDLAIEKGEALRHRRRRRDEWAPFRRCRVPRAPRRRARHDRDRDHRRGQAGRAYLRVAGDGWASIRSGSRSPRETRRRSSSTHR